MSHPSPPPRPSGSHPIQPERKKRPWWLLLLLGIVAILVLLLVLTQCGSESGSDSDSATPPANPTTPADPATSTDPSPTPASTPAATGSPSTTPAAPASPASTGTPAATGNDAGVLTAGTTRLLPVSPATPAGDLAALAGQAVTAEGVQVLAVPADEGFWVGTNETDRIWVQLTGKGESPYQVKVGDLVDFTGSMVKHGTGFANRVGVEATEGADQLNRQGAHIKAARTSVQPAAS